MLQFLPTRTPPVEINLNISDRHAKYVREADEAIYIGSISSATTHPHQDITLLVSTAIKGNADAIHPGRLYIDAS